MAIITETRSILSKNAYFINNPIYVDFSVSSDTQKVIITIFSDDKTSSFTAYPSPDNRIEYDVSEIIASFFKPSDYNPNEGIYQEIEDIKSVYFKFDIINKLSKGSTFTRSIKVIRGGLHTDQVNIGFDNDINLNPSNDIPYWEGYPSIFSRTGDDFDKIIIENLAVKQNNWIKLKGCNNVYVIFQNHLGGYSAWVFEDYEIKRTSSDTEYLRTQIKSKRQYYKTTGTKVNYQVNLISRVDSKYFPILNSLLTSQEIWVKDLPNMQGEGKDPRFQKIVNSGQTQKILSGTQVEVFNFAFDFPTTIKNQKTW